MPTLKVSRLDGRPFFDMPHAAYPAACRIPKYAECSSSRFLPRLIYRAGTAWPAIVVRHIPAGSSASELSSEIPTRRIGVGLPHEGTCSDSQREPRLQDSARVLRRTNCGPDPNARWRWAAASERRSMPNASLGYVVRNSSGDAHAA